MYIIICTVRRKRKWFPNLLKWGSKWGIELFSDLVQNLIRRDPNPIISHTKPPVEVIVITIYAQLVYVNFFPIDELNSDSCKHTKKCRYFYVLSWRGKGFFFCGGGGTLNPSTRSYASEKYFYIWCLNLNLEEIYTDKQSYDRLNPLIQAESFSYYKFQLILCVL